MILTGLFTKRLSGSWMVSRLATFVYVLISTDIWLLNE